jgi:hypothetical protein
VKLAEFNALCGREWEKRARGGRGDVVALHLTGPSAAELSADVLVNPQETGRILRMTPGEAEAEATGAALTHLRNPVTRSAVQVIVKVSGNRESARVRVMGGTCRRTGLPAST